MLDVLPTYLISLGIGLLVVSLALVIWYVISARSRKWLLILIGLSLVAGALSLYAGYFVSNLS